MNGEILVLMGTVWAPDGHSMKNGRWFGFCKAKSKLEMFTLHILPISGEEIVEKELSEHCKIVMYLTYC